MEQFKRAQVIMLPTKDISNLCLGNNLSYVEAKNGKTLSQIWEYLKQNFPYKPQHLYIISDDEIKEGDWFMLNEEHPQGRLRQCYHISDNNRLWNGENWDTLKGKHYFIQPTEKGSGFVTELECKKIIATTDTSLNYIIHDDTVPYPKGSQVRLPQPSQQFIEKYIESYNKGNIITDVLVEYRVPIYEDWIKTGEAQPNLLLKINPKDNTITIKKVKDSWNRKEIIELFNKFGSEATSKQISFNHIPSHFVADQLEINKFLEKNI